MRGSVVGGAIFLILVGVILADIWAKPAGTNAVANGLGGLWKTGVNGMLGKTS